jgi:hypothetical protein
MEATATPRPYQLGLTALGDRRTLKEVYWAYQDLWRRACAREKEWISEADPATGGIPLYAHNWHRCVLGTDREKPESRLVVAALERGARLTAYILRRSHRECALANHREHVARGEVGRYLWCDACQGRPWRGYGWD